MFRNLVIRKNNEFKFYFYLQKALCLGNTTITFAYEVGWKIILYEKTSTQKVTFDFCIRSGDGCDIFLLRP
jgi:hypothetical protein